LRGKPSNRRLDATLRQQVLDTYRQRFPISVRRSRVRSWPKLQLIVSPDTLRRWLLVEGLWQRQRRRDPHRSRRPRRSCFGELVQIDASIHDGWRGVASNWC